MIYNQDCMEAMKEMSDNQFDLAIVDPPYGIDIAKTGKLGGDKPFGKNGKRIKAVASTDYGAKEWIVNPLTKTFLYNLKE